MSELPDGIPRATEPEPLDSASAVILRRSAGGWEVLLGLRSRRSRFMPGHLAFPGGRRDPGDGSDDGRAHRCCASRELLEETGLRVAPEAWFEAGVRITPPMFPRRFRTFFFVAELEHGSDEAPPPADRENESLRWVAPAGILEDWRQGRALIPPPVLPILRALTEADDLAPRELAERIAEANAVEQQAPRIEFTPGLWMLPLPTATMPPATHTNVWIPGGRRFVLVDPAAEDAPARQRLRAVVARREAAGGRLQAILVTHHHQDHVDGVAALAVELGVPVRAHPDALALLGRKLDGCTVLPLGDGESIDLDGVRLEAVLTPGHAPGHLAFHLPQTRVLIAGDLISGLSTILIEPRLGDMGQFLESLERVRGLHCKLLLPGHGPPVPATYLDHALAHRRMREDRILEALAAAPRPLADIAGEAYSETPGLPAPLVEKQTLSHLLLLERRGHARRADPPGNTWSGLGRAPAGGARLKRIEALLRERLDPSRLEIRDDSAHHVGHPGATSGGGHYHVTVVSRTFEGLGLLERHRLVNDALSEMIGGEIHALGLTTHTPDEDPGQA